MNKSMRSIDENQKRFVEILRELATTKSLWQVWSDMIEVFACSISNAVDSRFWTEREERYSEIISKYGADERDQFAKLLAALVMALERGPFQDFLGKMFMRLELQSHWKGQYFTPDPVARLMARLSMGNWAHDIERRGWFSINDPCCGSGVMLIAAAGLMTETRSDFQHHALFVAQDIDRTAAMMCYVQLSLMGCAGYVKIGNSLSDPLVGNTLVGEQHERMWFTPMYFSETWHRRRLWNMVDRMLRGGSPV